MENTPTSFADLLLQLAGGKNKRPALAVSLGRKYWEVFYWEKHDYIPEKAWDDIIRLAHEKGNKSVTFDLLRELARKSREETR